MRREGGQWSWGGLGVVRNLQMGKLNLRKKVFMEDSSLFQVIYLNFKGGP